MRFNYFKTFLWGKYFFNKIGKRARRAKTSKLNLTCVLKIAEKEKSVSLLKKTERPSPASARTMIKGKTPIQVVQIKV